MGLEFLHMYNMRSIDRISLRRIFSFSLRSHWESNLSVSQYMQITDYKRILDMITLKNDDQDGLQLNIACQESSLLHDALASKVSLL